LLELEKISRPTLSKKFKVFFDKFVSPSKVWRVLPPTLTKTTKENSHPDPWVLGIDGKWLRRRGVVMIYRDVTHKENLFWSYWSSESYAALFTDLEKLVGLLRGGGSNTRSNLPCGVISDWKGSIVAGVASYLPHSHHQRCLVHVEREVKRLLPRNSGILAVSALRRTALLLTKIKTQSDKRSWLSELIAWEKLFDHLLKLKTINPNPTNSGKKWWYTHGNLRRAWRLLTDNWYPFFVHLDNPLIPNTNNSLEGVNSQIKKRLNQHRGMKILQQVSFLFWYLSFTRTKTKQDLKKIWDVWKT
jgi:hypothetical protein